MPAAGVVMIVAVVLIVAAVDVYLLQTIVALRRITAGLDRRSMVSAGSSRRVPRSVLSSATSTPTATPE